MIVYGNWRSLATYRVRVALRLKGLAFTEQPVDMQGNEHRGAAFRAINPQGVLPALDDGHASALQQSLAIIEYLDDVHPALPLLPATPFGRAWVRGLALVHAADAHPLLTPRVREFLQHDAGLDAAAIQRWLQRALVTALDAIEERLAASPEPGRYSWGDVPTVADICLVSHLIAMELFKVDASGHPHALRIRAACDALPAFAESHPLKQPGAPVAA